MEKCYKCNGSLGSHYQIFYLDRNGNLTSESELEAFYKLHPRERNSLKLDKVFVCGLCTFSFKQK